MRLSYFFKFISLFLLFLSEGCFSAYSQDSGMVAKFYSSVYGATAIQLSGGYANAVSTNQCPTANSSGWAAIGASAPASMKAALLAAKVTGASVTVTIVGCSADSSSWFNIVDVYLN